MDTVTDVTNRCPTPTIVHGVETTENVSDDDVCINEEYKYQDGIEHSNNSINITATNIEYNEEIENGENLIKLSNGDIVGNLNASESGLSDVWGSKDDSKGNELYIENSADIDISSHEVELLVTSGLRKRKTISVADYTRAIDPNSSPARDTYSKQKKVKNILKSFSSEDGVETLRQLAISRGGLLNDDLRKKAWPLLLGVDLSVVPEKPPKEVLHSHKDYEQVVLDVNRSLKRFPPGMEQEVRLSMQDKLVDCIMRVLVTQNELHYYQGYHDIVVTFLLVVGEDITVALMQQLSMKHLRDFMYENMDKTSSMLHYLYPLIGKCNHKVRKFMENAEVGTMFCLPWLITWYGHVLNDIKHIVRLYDFFIACHPLMPIYLAAAIVQYRGNEILQCEPEMPFIHCLLSNIPDDLPFEQLILEAGDLFVQYPPEELANEAKEQHEKYLEENRKKQEQLNHLKSIRAQRQKQSLWPFKWGQHKSHNISSNSHPAKTSTLVKMTVWTGAAVLSAVAVTFVNAYYFNLKSLDSWVDIHWLWGSK